MLYLDSSNTVHDVIVAKDVSYAVAHAQFVLDVQMIANSFS